MNVSVIVCTHNPRADYFARCLEGLRAQTLALDRWELLLVDNLSDRPVETTVDISWHPNARVIGESTLGLTPARLRGIRESHGDLLVFVDDDNVLTQDYLDQTERIANEHPFIGSWSGQCLPEFDVPPPEWTRRYWGALCIREFEKNVWSSLPLLGDTMPCGAGLCVRRRVALHYVGLYDRGVRSIVLDRVGTSLASGGDNDLAACACDLSLGVGLFSGLKLTHLIPPQRLTEDYLCRLVEAIEFSGAVLNAERGVSPPVRSLIGKAADQLRVWRQQGPHRKILRATFRGRDAAAHWIANKSVEQAPGFLSSILPTPRQTQN